MPKCRVCGAQLNLKIDDWTKPVNNYYYHTQCYDEWARKKNACNDIKNKADDDTWFESLYYYLLKDQKMTIDFCKFQSQWKNFLKQGFTAKGIYFSVRYIYEVVHAPVEKAQGGIGLVKNVYKEATQYWTSLENEKTGICAKLEQQAMEAARQSTIKFNRKKIKKSEKNYLLALEQIEQGGDSDE